MTQEPLYEDPRTEDEHMADVAITCAARLTDMDRNLALLIEQFQGMAGWADGKGIIRYSATLRKMADDIEYLREVGPQIAAGVLESCDDQRPRPPRENLHRLAKSKGWLRTVESPVFDRYEDGDLAIDLGWTLDEMTSVSWHDTNSVLTVREGELVDTAAKWLEGKEYV